MHKLQMQIDNLIKVQNLPYTAWNSGNPIGVGFVSGQDIGDMRSHVETYKLC